MKKKGLDALLDTLTKEIYIGRMHLWIGDGIHRSLLQQPNVADTAPVFFRLTLRAHAHEAFLHLARLFDTDPKTIRLRSLINEVEHSTGTFQRLRGQEVRKTLLPSVQKTIKTLEGKAGPILIRRNKIIAHLDPKVMTDLSSLEKEWTIAVHEMEDVYRQCGELVNELSGCYRKSQTLMEVIGWKDFEHVISYMSRGREAQNEEFEKKWKKNEPKTQQGEKPD